jgi:hypothetical protein
MPAGRESPRPVSDSAGFEGGEFFFDGGVARGAGVRGLGRRVAGGC